MKQNTSFTSRIAENYYHQQPLPLLREPSSSTFFRGNLSQTLASQSQTGQRINVNSSEENHARGITQSPYSPDMSRYEVQAPNRSPAPISNDYQGRKPSTLLHEDHPELRKAVTWRTARNERSQYHLRHTESRVTNYAVRNPQIPDQEDGVERNCRSSARLQGFPLNDAQNVVEREQEGRNQTEQLQPRNRLLSERNNSGLSISLADRNAPVTSEVWKTSYSRQIVLLLGDVASLMSICENTTAL